MRIGRRVVLAGAAGLGGCRKAAGPKAKVTVRKVASYSLELTEMLRGVIREHGLAVRGKRVVLKPNLVEFDPALPVNTNPAMVMAALEAFRAEGASEVRIAEGPGHRRPTLDLSEAAGYFETVRGFEGLFTDLNWADAARVDVPSPFSGLKELYLPKMVLGCDLLVSMPKMKTHHWVGATLSMKNFFGLAPGAVYGWPKNPLHWAGINEVIADLQKVVPATFAIVDGIEGMEGNGPIQGTLKKAGVIVAGRDMPAVDATCCRIMGIDPEQIAYLALAGGTGEVEQLGERPETVRTDFALIPEFADLRLARKS
ncbi:MAG: DUF362 domain-containing protein [Acidobacteria bacterium]|nr:DUF362 domain-containing protein [Acidobacteriota bacterium]